MKTIRRSTCILTSKDDLEPLYTFKNFPIFMGCTDKPLENDIFEDMEWCISKDSGCIQLSSLIPLDILYPESRGSGTIGSLWLEHHRLFAGFIQQFNVDSVLEIGGGHGTLSREFREKEVTNIKSSWTILEPNPRPAEGVTAKYITGFFDKHFVTSAYSAVVLSHVLEHLYNPTEFMQDLSASMAPGSLVFISVPNLKAWLNKHYMYSLHFEHHYLLLHEYVEYLFATNGFVLEGHQQFQADHSMFYAYRKVSGELSKIDIDFSELYHTNKEQYLLFIKNFNSKVEKLNLKLAETQSPVYLYLAHALSQYLLAFGLDTSKILKILDNDPHKLGKRFYGTSFMIDSPKCLAEEEHPVVIMGDSYFAEEIKRDILEKINPNTEFWN